MSLQPPDQAVHRDRAGHPDHLVRPVHRDWVVHQDRVEQQAQVERRVAVEHRVRVVRRDQAVRQDQEVLQVQAEMMTATINTSSPAYGFGPLGFAVRLEVPVFLGSVHIIAGGHNIFNSLNDHFGCN